MNGQPESEAPGPDAKERTRMGRDIVALLPRLRRFAAGLCGSVHDGDDIVQAACLRALERHYQWEPGTRLDSWMFRIIRNLWLDGRKSAWNRLVHNDEEALTGAPGSSLERELEARNELALARKAIAELPPQQREVLMLVTVEGQTYEAAADTLGIPLGTVMSRLARARVAVARSVRKTDAAVPAEKAARGG